MQLRGRLLEPTLRGNNEGAVTGCVGSSCGGPCKNIDRAGYGEGQKGGYAVNMGDKNATLPLDTLGPQAGYISATQVKNCGTQRGGGCGCAAQQGGACSSTRAGYGLVDNADTRELAKYGGHIVPTSTGGKKKRRKSTRKRKQKKRGRKCSKTCKCKKHNSKMSRRHSRKRVARRNKRKQRRRTRRRTRRRNRKMRGGYQQWTNNTPIGVGYSAPVAVTPSNSALANPVTIERYVTSGDNYNHFTGKSAPSPVLDQAVRK